MDTWPQACPYNLKAKNLVKTFVIYYSKSFMKYRQHVKFLSFFYKKRKIIFDTIKQRIDLLQFIEESKNKYQQAVLR